MVLRRGSPAGPEGRGAAAACSTRPPSCTTFRIAFTADSSRRSATPAIKGPLNGSPWQAPSMLPHYYNLNSDYKVGYIDRHNYFDGNGPEMFASMLTHPGSGYLGTGLQQVHRSAVRPVGVDSRLSERLRRGRAGHHGRLRHGPARLGRLLRVPVPGQPHGSSTTRPAGSPGASGRRTCPRRWASSPRWPG